MLTLAHRTRRRSKRGSRSPVFETFGSSWRHSLRTATSLATKPARSGLEEVMKKRASQLPLRWGDREAELPEEVQKEVRALLAQLMRAVAEIEQSQEEVEDE